MTSYFSWLYVLQRTVVLEISAIDGRIILLCICFAISFSPHIAIIILGKPARFGLRL